MSLLRTLFMCTTSSRKNKQVSAAQCLNHPDTAAKLVCLKSDCKIPYFCSHCKSQHSVEHKDFFIPLKTLFKDQEVIDYGKGLKKLFSIDYITNIKDQTLKVISQLEVLLLKSISDLREEVKTSFRDFIEEVDSRQKAYLDYLELLSLYSKKPQASGENLNTLLESYRRVKQDASKILDPRIDTLPREFLKEAQDTIASLHNQLSSDLKKNMNFNSNDFTKTQVKETFNIPSSQGILPNACAFIFPIWI